MRRVTVAALPSRQFRRKDGRVRSRILAFNPERHPAGSLLIEARWGRDGAFSNRTVVSEDHFQHHYGVTPIKKEAA